VHGPSTGSPFTAALRQYGGTAGNGAPGGAGGTGTVGGDAGAAGSGAGGGTSGFPGFGADGGDGAPGGIGGSAGTPGQGVDVVTGGGGAGAPGGSGGAGGAGGSGAGSAASGAPSTGGSNGTSSWSSTVPAPVLTGTDPASPGPRQVRLLGSGRPDTHVRLYRGAGCTGSPVATLTGAAFNRGTGTVTVPWGSTSVFSARAVSPKPHTATTLPAPAAEYVSACTADTTTYVSVAQPALKKLTVKATKTGSPGKVKLSFTTEAPGKIAVQLKVSKSVAKAAGLGGKTKVGTAKKTVRSGKVTLRVKVSKSAWAKLRSLSGFKLTVLVTQQAADGRTTSGRTRLRLP
jgi:hypothetical protein